MDYVPKIRYKLREYLFVLDAIDGILSCCAPALEGGGQQIDGEDDEQGNCSKDRQHTEEPLEVLIPLLMTLGERVDFF